MQKGLSYFKGFLIPQSLGLSLGSTGLGFRHELCTRYLLCRKKVFWGEMWVISGAQTFDKCKVGNEKYAI